MYSKPMFSDPSTVMAGVGYKGGGGGYRGRGHYSSMQRVGEEKRRGGGGGASTESFFRLFVGGLSLDTTKAVIKEYFEQWGEVTECKVVEKYTKNRGGLVSRGFGFVTYKEFGMVDQALACEPHNIDNCVVVVKRAKMEDGEKSGHTESFFKLKVHGLSLNTNKAVLKNHFQQWGEVTECIVMRNTNTRSRGFGFVTYTEFSMVEQALASEPHNIDNCVVVVRRAENKDPIQHSMPRNTEEITQDVASILAEQFEKAAENTSLMEQKLKKAEGDYEFGNFLEKKEIGRKEIGRNLIKEFDKPEKIHVKGLPKSSSFTEKAFVNIFSKFGRILSVKIPKRTKNSTSQGFGFIDYCEAWEAKNAREQMNGKIIKFGGADHILEVQRATLAKHKLVNQVYDSQKANQQEAENSRKTLAEQDKDEIDFTVDKAVGCVGTPGLFLPGEDPSKWTPCNPEFARGLRPQSRYTHYSDLHINNKEFVEVTYETQEWHEPEVGPGRSHAYESSRSSDWTLPAPPGGFLVGESPSMLTAPQDYGRARLPHLDVDQYMDNQDEYPKDSFLSVGGRGQHMARGISVRGRGQQVARGRGQQIVRGGSQPILRGRGLQILRGRGQQIVRGRGQHIERGRGQHMARGISVRGRGQQVARGRGQQIVRGGSQPILRGRGQQIVRGRGHQIVRGRGQQIERGRGQQIVRGRGQQIVRGRGQHIERGRGQQFVRGVSARGRGSLMINQDIEQSEYNDDTQMDDTLMVSDGARGRIQMGRGGFSIRGKATQLYDQDYGYHGDQYYDAGVQGRGQPMRRGVSQRGRGGLPLLVNPEFSDSQPLPYYNHDVAPNFSECWVPMEEAKSEDSELRGAQHDAYRREPYDDEGNAALDQYRPHRENIREGFERSRPERKSPERQSARISNLNNDLPRAWEDEEEVDPNMDQHFEYSEQGRNPLLGDLTHQGFKDKLDDRRERGRPIQRAEDMNLARSRDYQDDYQYNTVTGHIRVTNNDDIQDRRQRSISAEPLRRKPLDDYEPLPQRFDDETTSNSNRQYVSSRTVRNRSSTYQSRERYFYSRQQSSSYDSLNEIKDYDQIMSHDPNEVEGYGQESRFVDPQAESFQQIRKRSPTTSLQRDYRLETNMESSARGKRAAETILDKSPHKRRLVANRRRSRSPLMKERRRSRTPLRNRPPSRTPLKNRPPSRTSLRDRPHSRTPLRNRPRSRTPLRDGPHSRTPTRNRPRSRTPTRNRPRSRTPLKNNQRNLRGRSRSPLISYRQQILNRHSRSPPFDDRHPSKTLDYSKPLTIPKWTSFEKEKRKRVHALKVLTQSLTPEERLARREEEIQKHKEGSNHIRNDTTQYEGIRQEYKVYSKVVPKSKRLKDETRHPRTPDRFQTLSNRDWADQIRLWLLRVRAWFESYKNGTEDIGRPAWLLDAERHTIDRQFKRQAGRQEKEEGERLKDERQPRDEQSQSGYVEELNDWLET